MLQCKNKVKQNKWLYKKSIWLKIAIAFDGMYCLLKKILIFLSPLRFVSVKDTLVPTDEGEKSKVSS